MTPEEFEARRLFDQLQPGDREEVVHGVTVVTRRGGKFQNLTEFFCAPRAKRDLGLETVGKSRAFPLFPDHPS